MSALKTQRNNTVYVSEDKHKFKLFKRLANGDIWCNCCKNQRNKCTARIKTTDKHVFINQVGEHNHQSDPHDLEKTELITGIKRRSRPYFNFFIINITLIVCFLNVCFFRPSFSLAMWWSEGVSLSLIGDFSATIINCHNWPVPTSPLAIVIYHILTLTLL